MERKLKPLCEKCPHRDDCIVQCAPIEILLSDVSDRQLSEYGTASSARQEILLKNWREQYFFFDKDTKAIQDFADTPENRLGVDIDTSGRHAYIFVQRVFLGRPLKEICEEIGMPLNTGTKVFQRQKERVLRVVQALAARKNAHEWAKTTRASLTPEQKLWVLYRCFRLKYEDIKKICPELVPETRNKFLCKTRFFQSKLFKRIKSADGLPA